ncbi:DNA-binding response regulator [Rhodococcus sp. 05-340-1]|jgi:two-component system KDP operon response regulator KdpE|uniref:response regulator n=1 Tax=Nocardiaceae TaxID=85025 RepID=UPI00055CF783|nr:MULTISPECIES: response regulator [Rhodococcus]OZD60449.1 DNA-binding response regulator [Rhodococcus sp. 05-340-2]OZD79183.1 DNA-binding response regulator [Rhodococcus sp. 05-340-1]OZF05114.1 DNA-binding response regulator [Rhodococcus sp. 15-2388-1-1a]OZF33661.1 DNA-binding response regulator [Rhodococcus sp. 14-2483-1-2]
MGESRSAIKVLVVDDEPQIVRALRINLAARGYNVVTAATGTGALRAIASEHPDVVILDLGLPDIGGLDVLAGVRGWSEIPVIVLSARTDSGDKIDALDAGADDYITKPFGMDEFLARLRVAVRRRAITTSPTDPLVTTSSFTVDLASKRVTRDGEIVHLTRTEWGVLEMLARNAGKLVGQKELLRTVWGPGHDHGSNYLRIYMSQLRRKLEIDPGKPRHLITETGMGYRLVE